jgi:dihydrolipoamide dehydrogenase
MSLITPQAIESCSDTIRINALLHIAKSINSIRGAKSQGLEFKEPSIDLAAIHQWLDSFSGTCLHSSGINSTRIAVEPLSQRPAKHPLFTAQDARLWCYTDAIAVKSIPSKLAIIGTGAMAIEIATIYQALGSEVDIIIPGNEIFPTLDADINKSFQRYVKRLFKIKSKAEITEVNYQSCGINIAITSKGKALPAMSYDAVFVTPEQEKITSQPFIVNSFPTVAWIGLNEQELTQQDIKYKAINLPWRSLGRANTDVNTNGLTKLIFATDSHVLLAGGAMGNNADEIFGEICLAVHKNFTADDLAKTVHAHPTLHESILLAAEVYKGTATDVLNE